MEMDNENAAYSEIVLNTVVDVFNQDGVSDRQMIHKRTIDFVNERYLLLSNELDSIEIILYPFFYLLLVRTRKSFSFFCFFISSTH